MKIISGQLKLNHGLTRLDVLGVVGGLLALAAVAYACIWVGGEKRRIWVCASHLKTLGKAFSEYANDHNGCLPLAGLDNGTNGSTAWDKEIMPYLVEKSARSGSPDLLKTKYASLFQCPSDREPHGGELPRSYAMTTYDINRAMWPADGSSLGGLGLSLDGKSLRLARKAMPTEGGNYFPAIKISIVPEPADTALLVEHINILNTLGATRQTCVGSTKEQFEAKTFEAKDFHGGKMNYLMLDGHVELLAPESVSPVPPGIGRSGGFWTIRPQD